MVGIEMVCGTALELNDCVTVGAAAKSVPPLKPPACVAEMVHVPGAMRLTDTPLTVQTLGVDEVKVTGNVEDALTVRLKSATLYRRSAGAANVIVCFFLTTNVRVTLGAAA